MNYGFPRGRSWRQSLAALLLPLFLTSWGELGAQVRFDADSRSRGLLWGAGHSWKHGLPGYGKTETDIAFAAFHPQMGWFVTDRLELYGEGTLLVYFRPQAAVSAGLAGLAGRYHFRREGRTIPYAVMGGGILWTSLTVPEIDRIFNFQVLYGAGLRLVRDRSPGWIVEFRNHHISNAGTAGENLGINTATILLGIEWVLP